MMLILGFTGGIFRPSEMGPALDPHLFHDASAALLRDGVLIAAVEQERVDRIKHSNRLASDAIAACLEIGRIAPGDVDVYAYYVSEARANRELAAVGLKNFSVPSIAESYRALLCHRLGAALGTAIPAERLRFVRHDLAHARSAFMVSGFEAALVVTNDGEGDGVALTVSTARGQRLELVQTFPEPDSLGLLYLECIPFIGFGQTEEYKVMGLAPYGDSARYEREFSELYELLPGGSYRVYRERIPQLFALFPPRKSFAPIERCHMDFAAALQRALLRIVMHVLHHHRQQTGLRDLCMAGGVAQNCTVNGAVLASGLFERVFVQPVASDSGCALGAALEVWAESAPAGRVTARLEHLYLGRDLGTAEQIEAAVHRWHAVIPSTRLEDPAEHAAGLIAAGHVLGWAQGRAEYGPRALGNRSILADPRPAENKDRVNAMVKKREAFRPFAPSVLEEYLDEYFDVPAGVKQLPFMIFTVKVRPEKRDELGAITHVDGTARVQTVSRATNPSYWRLIEAFRQRTGCPIVLNTSFNNHAEPIVDSVDDAVTTFLTTGLDHLVVGSSWLSKSDSRLPDALGVLQLSIPAHVCLRSTQQVGDEFASHELFTTYDPARRRSITPALFSLLARVASQRPLSGAQHLPEFREQRAELGALWSERWVRFRPDTAGPAARPPRLG